MRVVRFPEPTWWADGNEVLGRGLLEVTIRGDLVRVRAPSGWEPALGSLSGRRRPTIELSRNPLRIDGIDSPREWILVRGSRDGREYQLAMTKSYDRPRWPDRLSPPPASARRRPPAGLIR